MRSTGPGWNLYGERSNPAWLDSRLNFLCPGRLDKAQRKFWAVKGFNVADYDGSPGCTFLSLGLLEQSGVAVGGRGMRVVATFLATEIYAGIARIIPRRRGAHFLLLETLLSRPGFDQRAVYGEVFVGKQFVLPGQIHHLLKERLSDIRFEQPFAAHAIQALQQERTQQLLGRDGGRPTRAYILLKRPDRALSTSSTSGRKRRRGWFRGTRCSGER